MAKHKKGSLSLQWQTHALDTPLKSTVRSLVDQLGDNYDHDNIPLSDLSEKDQRHIKARKRYAEQARGPALTFMYDISDRINMKNQDMVSIASMKRLERVVDKYLAGRSTDDIGRGRIYISRLDQYELAEKLLRSITKEGNFRGAKSDKIKFLKDNIENYLKSPKELGFAGSINLPIEVEFTKGRVGRFEIQIMPEQFEKADKLSHKLYDMIRIIDEIPERFRTEEQEEIKSALVEANRALFVEEAIRFRDPKTGTTLMDLRDDDYEPPTLEEWRTINSRLDLVVDEINGRRSEREEWHHDVLDAIAYSKTSLSNLYLAGQEARAENTNEHS